TSQRHVLSRLAEAEVGKVVRPLRRARVRRRRLRMAKGSRSITPDLNQRSTSPQTRVIDPSRGIYTPAEGAGSVKAAPQPIPSQAAAHARRQKPDSPVVPVVGGAFDSETTEAQAAHL